jgi:osmotically inducible protein OsmC
MNKLDKVLYTAHATSTGGRDGISKTDDGKLNLKLSVPKAMGGDDGAGTKAFCIAVKLVVKVPGMANAEAQKIVNLAHEICPYSNATRGNIEVNITLA